MASLLRPQCPPAVRGFTSAYSTRSSHYSNPQTEVFDSDSPKFLSSRKGERLHHPLVEIERDLQRHGSGGDNAPGSGATSTETCHYHHSFPLPVPDRRHSTGPTQQQIVAEVGCSSTAVPREHRERGGGGGRYPYRTPPPGPPLRAEQSHVMPPFSPCEHPYASHHDLFPAHSPPSSSSVSNWRSESPPPPPPRADQRSTIAPFSSCEYPHASRHHCRSPVHPPTSSSASNASARPPHPPQQQSPTHPPHNCLHYGCAYGRYQPLGTNVYAADYDGVPRSATISMGQQPEEVNVLLHNGETAANTLTHPRRIRLSGEGCRVLSIDGGGFRGYASLLSIRNLLRRIVPDSTTPVYPYLHFDLICGTSTGGLIATMLAVLHLDIDTAIQVYEEFGKTVFGTHPSKLRYLARDERFDSKLLKRAVSEILGKYGEGRTLMEDPTFDRGCKCFVTVAHRNQDKAQVLLVRSYPLPRGTDSIPNGHQWTILDAAMATTAAPTFFRPHRITTEGHSFYFEDAGAHGANNPTTRAWKELDSSPTLGVPPVLSV